jgi:NAD(P)H-dependent FMN reductase
MVNGSQEHHSRTAGKQKPVVLAIIGSPRKGNTYQAIKRIEAAIGESRDIEFRYLFLRDTHIEACTGCQACITQGEENCPQKEERDAIERQMMDADGIIFASPVYAQQVTALMKAFLEHFAYYWHRPRFFGKTAMAVVTGGGRFTEVLKYLVMNAKSWGFSRVFTLGVPHLGALAPRYRRKAEIEIDETARAFAATLESRTLPTPSLRDLFWFRMWRVAVQSSPKGLPYDNQYWREKGWFSRDYYYDAEIGILKRALADLIERIIRFGYSKRYVGD